MWPVPSPAPPPWSRPTDPVWEHQSGSPPSPETSMLAGHNPNDRPVMPANSGIEHLRQLPQFCRSSAWSGALDRANLMLLRLNSVRLKRTALAVLRDAGRHGRLERSPAERLGVQNIARSSNRGDGICRLTLDRGASGSRAPNPGPGKIAGE